MTAPVASPRRKSDKIWRDALIRALGRRREGGVDAGLDELADNVVALANTGDVQAIKEIGDRIDGKPKQQTEVTGADGEPLLTGVDVRIVQSPSRTA